MFLAVPTLRVAGWPALHSGVGAGIVPLLLNASSRASMSFVRLLAGIAFWLGLSSDWKSHSHADHRSSEDEDGAKLVSVNVRRRWQLS